MSTASVLLLFFFSSASLLPSAGVWIHLELLCEEEVYEATMNKKLFLRPGDEVIASVQIRSALRTLICQGFAKDRYGQAGIPVL